MASSNPLSTIFQCIDQNQDKLLERLREAISILPDSSSEKSLDSTQLMQWTNDQMKSFGFTTTLKNIEEDGGERLPPVIFADLETGHCPNKSTVLVYSQLDGTSETEDGWNVESVQAEEKVNVKGALKMSSVIAWLNTIEAFRTIETDIPVNLKFIIASAEMESSMGLRNLLISEKEHFLGDVEYICVNEGSWLRSDTPCFVKKLRGFISFSIEVQCSANNLDMKCAGIVQEATNDLLYLLGCLTDEKGNFDFAKINLQAEDLCEEEKILYETTDLDLDIFMKANGANSLSHKGDKSEMMKYRILVPNLTIHSIDTSLECGNDWSIPSVVSAKLTISCYHKRMKDVFESLSQFLKEQWAVRESSNELRINLERTHETWFADLDHVHYDTAVKAAQHVYQKPLHFLNSAFSIPLINMLQEVIDKHILLLPISSENSYMNETVSTKNYLDACKMFASYLNEMGEIPKISSASSSSFVSCDIGPEICVCGRVDEEIPSGSGDAEAAPPPKQKSISEEDESKCDCPYRPQVQTKDEAVISDDLLEDTIPPPPPKPCKCVLQYQPVDVEIISLKSNLSKDLTPTSQDEESQKKNLTASVDTIKCSCIPERYRALKKREKKVLTPEKEEELMKSMRYVGSRISGLSACEYPSGPHEKTPKMNMLGCVCPEKSQETIIGVEIQKNRLFCPVKKGHDEICNKGGKRKHYITGPPPIEEDESEISLGPLSHCSCQSEESIVLPPNCDCSKEGPPLVQNEGNIEDELD